MLLPSLGFVTANKRLVECKQERERKKKCAWVRKNKTGFQHEPVDQEVVICKDVKAKLA